MIKLKSLNQLKRLAYKEFQYKGMTFHQGSSSAESLAGMIFNRANDYRIEWRAYTGMFAGDGGDKNDGSQIIMYFKAVGSKIIPYKVVHAK